MKFYTLESEHKSIFKTFAIYYICMAVFCGVRIVASLGALPDNTWGEIISTILIQFVVLFLLPFFLYCFLLKEKPREIFNICNFNKCNYKVILISFGLGLVCFIINIAVSSLFNGILAFTGYEFATGGSVNPEDFTFWNFLLDLLLVAVIPAFAEEFLHRGIVLQGIKHMGFKKAIVISSLLFALLHLNVQQVGYAFVIGLILGFVAVVSKNIYPAIIIHFVNNALSTYIDYAQINDWFLGDMLSWIQNILITSNPLLIFICSCMILIGVIGLLCLLIWLLYKETYVLKINKAMNKAYSAHDFETKDGPIILNRNQIIKDAIENYTLLNLDFKKTDSPIDIVMPKEKYRYLTCKRDKIFLWCSIVLGGLITFFTYVWGLF